MIKKINNTPIKDKFRILKEFKKTFPYLYLD